MKLVWLEQAAVILAKIATENDNIGVRVVASAGQLRESPEAGYTGRCASTREIPVIGHPYTIVYRTKGDEVQVLSLRHTSRRWPD